MRIPIILFTGFFFLREIASLVTFLEHPSLFLDAQFVSALAARISLIAFLGLLVFFHFTRSQPINQAAGWQPKISALLGLTLGNLLLLLNRASLPPMMDLMSALFLIVGNYLCIVTLFHLGRSISIMAEARQLVTSGPYRFVRHPLYLAEEIATIGIFMQFMSWQAAVVLGVHFIFQIVRMRNEERVLSATFPEYHDYAQRTARLIPGVW
ncbi:MAG: isoprenylcysteine carboxylmethyltransferase family protein [Gallionella sp.]